MDEREWEEIERRLTAVWPSPPMDEARRADYRAVLADLDRPVIMRAIDELAAVRRDGLPDPQALRHRARAGAPVFLDPPATPATRVPSAPAPPPPDAAPAPLPGFAVAALVLGICGWIALPFIGGVLAATFGVLALTQPPEPSRRRGRTAALWGLCLGVLSVLAWMALTAAVAGSD